MTKVRVYDDLRWLYYKPTSAAVETFWFFSHGEMKIQQESLIILLGTYWKEHQQRRLGGKRNQIAVMMAP